MKEIDLSDHNLIEGCKKGDRKVQELLYRKFASEMYSICLSYESDRDTAKDILQTAFLKVFRNIEKFKFKGSLKSWIRRIITNTAIDFYRKKKDSLDVEFNDEIYESNDSNNDNFEINSDNYDQIISEIAKLPSKARIIFNLYTLEGLSHKEISSELDVSIGTSKSQLNRAKQLLREAFKNIESI